MTEVALYKVVLTEAGERALALRESGKTADEIGLELGVPAWRVQALIVSERPEWRKIRSVRPYKPYNPEKYCYIVELRKAGKSLSEIGQEIGISSERVRQIVKQYAPDYKKPRKLHDLKCVNCGADFQGKKTERHCSSECKAEWKRKLSMAHSARMRKSGSDALNERAIALRRGGMGWRDVAVACGKPADSYTHFYRSIPEYAERTGADISGVFVRKI